MECTRATDDSTGRRGLPLKARTAFLLAQFEGLPYDEIAERLQVHVRTVKRYMAMAFEECILLAI